MNDDNTSPRPLPEIRLIWFEPATNNPERNSQMIHELTVALTALVFDGWEVIARTPAGNGVLYELRRGGAE